MWKNYLIKQVKKINLIDIVTFLSLVVGITSIVLAIISIVFAKNSEVRSQENFEKTQKMMNEIYDKTKDLLHEIDNKSASISGMVEKNQTQLTTLFSNILDKVIPNQDNTIVDMSSDELEKITNDNNEIDSNKLMMQLLPELIKNPDSLERLVDISEKIRNK